MIHVSTETLSIMFMQHVNLFKCFLDLTLTDDNCQSDPVMSIDDTDDLMLRKVFVFVNYKLYMFKTSSTELSAK